MIGWNLLLPPEPPLGATSGEFTYYRVGTGTPAGGGQLGYDVTWSGSGGAVVGQSLCGLVGAVEITEAEYELLLADWRLQ